MSLLGDLTGRRPTSTEADSAHPPGEYDPAQQIWSYPTSTDAGSRDRSASRLREFYAFLSATGAITFCPTTMGGRDGDKDDETA